jgi:YbbR domain-containing protein
MRNWPAKILSLVAAIFIFLFYTVNSLEERFFTVPLKLYLAEGYVAAGPYPRSVRVTLRGESDTIYRILEEDIEVYADFSRHNNEGLFRASIEFIGRGSAETSGPLEITVEPRELTLEIEKNLRKSVKVLPTMTGYPEKGFELSQYFITPNTVDVEGPRSHVENLDTVLTETVDLSGRSSDFTFRARLNVEDAYLSLPGGDSVEFLGIIRETVIIKNFTDIGMVTFDLDPRFELANPPQTGTIQLQGAQLNLGSLGPEDLFLSIDCSRIQEPGIYTVVPRPEVPPGVSILDWAPVTVNLEVVEIGEDNDD